MREDIGQLLWVGFEGTRAPDELLERLSAGRAGATILFGRRGDSAGNLEFTSTPSGPQCNLDALSALIESLHRATADGTLALVAVDQEGGRVQRVRAPATVWPPMAAFGALTANRRPTAEVEALAEQVGLAMGRELRALGFDIDFAPVLDIHTNPANPIIGDRAFSTAPESAARYALAHARGLAAAGILACGKHFPGHGDTSTDSHLELPRIDHDWPRLETTELLPFARAATTELPMIMTAHVVFGAIDPSVPATLSHAVITGLLRTRLGYRGVIVSDDLDMKAISDPATAAIAAINAGVDVLLLCKSLEAQFAVEEALIKRAEFDSEFRARIGESALRVREMKRAYLTSRAPALGRDIIGSAEHRALAARLAGN